MKYAPILALFKGLSLFLKLGSGLDPDPHQGEKSDPDQEKSNLFAHVKYMYRIVVSDKLDHWNRIL
jgi:hypothetical protein